MWSRFRARSQRLSMLVFVLLFIEFLDELVFGAREATMPLLRDAIGLNYIQISLLISIPPVISAFIEPFIGILGDTAYRKPIIVIGGVFFTAMILAMVLSQTFLALLLSFIIIFFASGAFVSLAQATLMDIDPSRHDQNMVRWTFAGSLGVVAGPLLLSITLSLGLAWQSVYFAMAFLSLIAVGMAMRYLPTTLTTTEEEEPLNFRESFRNALTAVRRFSVMRWVILLQFSDFMLDVLLSYLALYFVDVVGLSVEQAALSVVIWTGVGLIGDFLIVYLLERVDGLVYLRITGVLQMVFYALFLSVDNLMIKWISLAFLGFFNAGWYSILKARLYSSLPGQSGIVLFVSNIGGLFGAAAPFIIGAIASRWGLEMAMWVILLGPIAVLIGLPRYTAKSED